jgi:cytochrome c
MKKSFLIITLCMALAACGGSATKDSADSATSKADAQAHSPNADTTTNNPKNGTEATGAASKGEGLMAAADCATCHRPDMKLVGPSFKDIANKYTADDVDKLALKIIKGGSGVWGDVAMTPHPAIAESEAKEMVKYILTKK